MEEINHERLEAVGQAFQAKIREFEFTDLHILLANHLLANPEEGEDTGIIDEDMVKRMSQLLVIMCINFMKGEHCLVCALGEAVAEWPKAEIVNVLKIMEQEEGAVRPYTAEDIENMTHAAMCLSILSYQLFTSMEFLSECVHIFLKGMNIRVMTQSSPHMN